MKNSVVLLCMLSLVAFIQSGVAQSQPKETLIATVTADVKVNSAKGGFAEIGKNVELKTGKYTFRLADSTVRYGPRQKISEIVLIRMNIETRYAYFTLNGIGDSKTVDVPSDCTFSAFFVPGEPTYDDSGISKIEIFRAASETGSGESSPTPSPITSKNRQTIKKLVGEEAFTFELESCKLDADSAVTCSFTVKNNYTEDIRFNLLGESYNGNTRLYDQTGTEYIAEVVSLGSQIGRQRQPVENALIPEVATRATVKFIRVSPQASNVSLSIACYLPRFGGGPSFNVTFFNVPIDR